MVIGKFTETGVKAPLPIDAAVTTHEPLPIAFKRLAAMTHGPVTEKSTGAPEVVTPLNT